MLKVDTKNQMLRCVVNKTGKYNFGLMENFLAANMTQAQYEKWSQSSQNKFAIENYKGHQNLKSFVC